MQKCIRWMLAVCLVLWPCAVVAQDVLEDESEVVDDPAHGQVEDALRKAGVFGGNASGSAAPPSAAGESSPDAQARREGLDAPAPPSGPLPPAPVSSTGGAAPVAPQGYSEVPIGPEDMGVTKVLYPGAKASCESEDKASGQLPGKFGLYKFVAQRPDCSMYGITLPYSTTLSGAQLGFGRSFSQNAAWDPILSGVAACLKSDPRIKGRVVPRMDATRIKASRLKDSEFVSAAKMTYGMAPSELNDSELQTLVGNWRIEGIMRLLRAKGVDTTSRVVGSSPEISSSMGPEERGMKVELFWEPGKPIYVPYCERRPAPPERGLPGKPGKAGRSGFEVSLSALCEIGTSHYAFCGGQFDLLLNLTQDLGIYGDLAAGAGTYSNPVDSYEFEDGVTYFVQSGAQYWFAKWIAAKAGVRYEEENVDREFYRSSRGFGVVLDALFFPGEDQNFFLNLRGGHLWWARVEDQPAEAVGRDKGDTNFMAGALGWRFW